MWSMGVGVRKPTFYTREEVRREGRGVRERETTTWTGGKKQVKREGA